MDNGCLSTWQLNLQAISTGFPLPTCTCIHAVQCYSIQGSTLTNTQFRSTWWVFLTSRSTFHSLLAVPIIQWTFASCMCEKERKQERERERERAKAWVHIWWLYGIETDLILYHYANTPMPTMYVCYVGGDQIRSIRPNFVAILTKEVLGCKSLKRLLLKLIILSCMYYIIQWPVPTFNAYFYQTLMLLHIRMLTVRENFISLCYQLKHFVSFFNVVLVLVGVPSQSQLTIPKPYIYNHVKLWKSGIFIMYWR